MNFHAEKYFKLRREPGVVAIAFVFMILFIALSLALSIVFVFLNRLEVAKNVGYSEQAFYATESGVEDALLRLMDPAKSLPPSLPYTFYVASASVEVDVQDQGNVKTVIVEGDLLSRVRAVGVEVATDTTGASLIYGAQVGAGGIAMSQGSQIIGSVYSNGSISGDNNAEITGDAFLAQNGNRLEDIEVGGNAAAYSMEDCTVNGNATFVTGGGINDCDILGTTTEQPTEIPTVAMPISQAMIDGWKSDAEVGGTISAGDYQPAAGSTVTIGPGVIEGNMIIKNNQTVNLSGTVWVRGYVDVDNGSSIRLTAAYGADSGMLITDSWVHVKNNGEFRGSGTAGSYIMILTTSACDGSSASGCTHHNAALDLHNNAEGAIFYAGSGLVNLHNNVGVTQLTAWKVALDNNAVVQYSIGLADFNFSSGPSGGWNVSDWREQ